MTELLQIIIPFYNASATIERTVTSLAMISASNRRRTRVIGVDDGSSDQSAAIFERSISQVDNIEYVLLRKANGGSGSARNAALQTFETGWCLFLDADDELLADPFRALDQHHDKSSVLFSVEYCREDKPVKLVRPVRISGSLVPSIFTTMNPLGTLTAIFRRSRVINLFNDELLYLEDWHFWAVNPDIFENCVRCTDICLGRVHISGRNKTSDLYQNGLFRIRAAELIESFWRGRLGKRELNNLFIQKTIGNIQMGERKEYSAFLHIPASLSLYLKLIVYTFFFSLYRRFGPYAPV